MSDPKFDEKYIYKWSIIDTLVNLPFILFFSFVGGLFLILYIELRSEIGLFQYFELIKFVLPGLFIIILILRKYIIKIIIRMTLKRQRLDIIYKIPTLLLFIQVFLPFYNIITIYLHKLYPEIVSNKMLLLITTMTFLYLPIYFTFYNILNENGLIFIEFHELIININNFIKRQYWLKKISIRIKKIFRRGNIIIDSEEVVYDLNINFKNKNYYNKSLGAMQNWFLLEKKNEEFKDIFLKIWPNVSLNKYQKIKWYENIQQIPYQYIKLCAGFLIMIIMLFMYPSEIKNILQQLMNKLI